MVSTCSMREMKRNWYGNLNAESEGVVLSEYMDRRSVMMLLRNILTLWRLTTYEGRTESHEQQFFVK